MELDKISRSCALTQGLMGLMPQALIINKLSRTNIIFIIVNHIADIVRGFLE
jgi:hypothetical protein